MLFISTGIVYDKHRPQMLSVGTTANSPLRVGSWAAAKSKLDSSRLIGVAV